MFTHSFALPLHYPSLIPCAPSLSTYCSTCRPLLVRHMEHRSRLQLFLVPVLHQVSLSNGLFCLRAIESNQNPPGNLSLWTSCVLLSRFRYPHPFFPPSLSSAINDHYHQRLRDIAVLRTQLREDISSCLLFFYCVLRMPFIRVYKYFSVNSSFLCLTIFFSFSVTCVPLLFLLCV